MPVLAISMSLNQVSRAGPSTRSDRRAFPTTNHRTSNSTNTGADKRPLESAVVRSVIAPGAPLSIDT
jgi:hypothetical protein